MKRRQVSIILCLSILCLSQVGTAQTPFNTIDSIDVNNINASVLIHGDMWSNPGFTAAKCEYPKGEGISFCSAAGIWMGGFDASNKLHVAAATNRQKGVDYWPGPIDPTTGKIDYTNSQNWARIWKINRADISAFLSLSTHTTANTPKVILEWPAKGNIYAKGNAGTLLSITSDMAPFVDADHDGIYNPLNGDYPDVKGDQALWWVINDNGPTHTETNGTPLAVEIHAMAYAYKGDSALDNIVYYQYTLLNKSANNYTNFRFGLKNKSHIGYILDDLIGCDTARRLEIIYCGKNVDGTGAAGTYGTAIPIAGISIVQQPGDIKCSSYAPLGSFIYYNNDFSVMGNPTVDTQYYNYMIATWRDGTHLKNDFKGPGIPSIGYGSGSNTNYVYSGKLKDTTAWSECNSQDLPGDRVNLISSNYFTLAAGASQTIVIALLGATDQGGCPSATFDAIKAQTDFAWHYHCTPPTTAVTDISINNTLKIYPNPAHDFLYLESSVTNNDPVSILVYNVLGQAIPAVFEKNSNLISISTSSLRPGMYTLVYKQGAIQKTTLFVKE